MKNKKVVIGITSIVAVLLVIIGVTYAYWLVTKTQTNENVISSGCLDISLTGEKNDIILTNQFPLSDEEGMKLTPYEFTITNNCNTSVDYHINLESIGEESTAIKAGAIKAVIDTNIPRRLYEYVGAEPTVSGAYESYTLLYGTLAGASDETTEDTLTHELRIWIDAGAPINEQNKTFTSKISVSVGQHISSQGSTLASLILGDAQENNYLYTTTPDFSIGTAEGEYGLYSAEDDLGTSYYFRGAPTNNYVKFGEWSEDLVVYRGYTSATDTVIFNEYATLGECTSATSYNINCSEFKYASQGDPMYWRIVRINGDGTIRMIYDGTAAAANGVAHIATLGMTAYNSPGRDAKHIGYTYDVDGTQTDSTIKGVVDKWYEDNLEATYGKYVADSIFCNDREIAGYERYANPNQPTEPYMEPYYGSYARLKLNKVPQLTCARKEDRYTTSGSLGNGLLTKPVGLLTADEAMFAGGKENNGNYSYYIYSNQSFWTSSPYTYIVRAHNAQVMMILAGGSVSSSYGVSYGGMNVRPVINLKADVKFTGDGRIDTNSPYEIIMN